MDDNRRGLGKGKRKSWNRRKNIGDRKVRGLGAKRNRVGDRKVEGRKKWGRKVQDGEVVGTGMGNGWGQEGIRIATKKVVQEARKMGTGSLKSPGPLWMHVANIKHNKYMCF